MNKNYAFYVNKSNLYMDNKKANSEILQMSINAFHLSNPDFDIILLHDGEESFENCTMVHLDEFKKESDDFELIYKDAHCSPNPYEYELFCFARWYIVKAYIDKNNLNNEYYVIFDNDTLSFGNYTDIYERLSQHKYDISISKCGCPAFTIFNRKTLGIICEYMIDSLKQETDAYEDCKRMFSDIISDMHIIHYLVNYDYMRYPIKISFNDYPNDVNNIGYYNTNNSIYEDYTLYKKDNKIYVQFINTGDYYVYRMTTHFPCAGIHFAGDTKRFMKGVYEQYMKLLPIHLNVDKCYCIHLAERKEYESTYIDEFKNRLGIENDINVIWSSIKPVNKYISDLMIKDDTEFSMGPNAEYNKWSYKNNNNYYAYVFDCCYNHYATISTSLARGFNNIFIMEDDIKFIEDTDLVKEVFRHIPDDYDCILLYTNGYADLNSIKVKEDNDSYFINSKDIDKNNCIFNSSSAGMYFLSKKGMKRYIEHAEKYFIADWPFAFIKEDMDLKTYYCNYNIVKINFDKSIINKINNTENYEE